jgi:poly(hydroxyalkanoate) depolymerase family esterase
MNDSISHRMSEATRLTRAGRLGEATAFIQRLLRGDSEPAQADAVGPPIIDVVPDKVELTEARATEPTPPSSHPPEGLRSFLKRFNLHGAGQPASPSSDTAAGGRFNTLSFANEAGSRSYKLYTPSVYHGQALPLIVMLHGCTQSPDDFAAGTRMNDLAETHGCFVAYPAQSSSANMSKCWNWFNPADQRRDRGEPSLIAGITRDIMRDHAIDPSRVYVAGLSAGGAAAAVMGAAYPDLYAAIGVHSGLACGAARDVSSAMAAMRQGAASAAVGKPGRTIPAIVFHGDKDPTVNPRNGDQVVEQILATGTGLQTTAEDREAPGGRAYRRTLYADANGQPVIEQWVVHGGGHAWFGGSAAGSYTDPRGPDASAEMLRFFLAHPHPSPAG